MVHCILYSVKTIWLLTLSILVQARCRNARCLAILAPTMALFFTRAMSAKREP